MSTVIASVDHRSPAQRAGIRPGEKLLTINGHEIVDVLDYRFYGYDAKCRLELLEPNGSVRNVQIKKEEGLDLGLNFDTYLMDEMRCCANHCVFCFVDQMPPGMRQTLYFKDDDARLSFLQGNYITLTNLTEREAQRIIDLRISPINVSVHTTDPQLHCTMLGNKNAVRSLEYMRRFCEAGIVMNGQIVICPGWNDGDYEGYRQLENGVGMLRSLGDDFLAALDTVDVPEEFSSFTIATGTAAAPFLTGLVQQAQARFPDLRGEVVAIDNDFFGHTIDVAGLLTGQDISAQLQKRPLGDRVLIPLHMLRHGETVFLDDYTVERLSQELGRPVQVVGLDGFDLADALFAPAESRQDNGRS